MARFFSSFAKIMVTGFALVGFIFVGVFAGMQFGVMNVRGTIDERNAAIVHGINLQPRAEAESGETGSAMILCKIHAIANYAPETAEQIQNVFQSDPNKNRDLVGRMISVAAAKFPQTDLGTYLDACARVTIPDHVPSETTAYAWAKSAEWGVMKAAFVRDHDVIIRAATDAGISPRLLLGGVIGEQFRFFTGSRDSFKRYFEPLKILASLSKFSYGIAGLKPETAALIDEHLKNPQSKYYLGPSMESVITYPPGSDPAAIRFTRITDSRDPYYSYLYVGLFMRQIMAQWSAAGYDISNRPDVLSTLYNLGFNRSVPKSDPDSGGAMITIDGTTYSFGTLGHEFYYSGELADEFPY